MPSTIFVTGATGQTGGNVCEQLIQRGDQVRALVRNPDEASALAGIGVELVKGDISDADDVLRAAKGAEAAIHCAALLGGASQDLEDFKAVNMVGTTNVLDAAKSSRHASGGGPEHRHLPQSEHRGRLRRGTRAGPTHPKTPTRSPSSPHFRKPTGAPPRATTC